MYRDVIGVIAGAFALFAVYTGCALLEMKFFPLPTGLDPHNPTDLAVIVAGMTLLAKAVIVAGWCLSAFVGATVAARIANHRIFAALLIGAFVAAATMVNAVGVPYPKWMNLTGTVLPLTLAWLATRLMPGPPPPPPPVKRWIGNEHER
jgi:uncharacterized membrane protein